MADNCRQSVLPLGVRLYKEKLVIERRSTGECDLGSRDFPTPLLFGIHTFPYNY